MNKTKMARDLTEGGITRSLISFSAPFVLANLLQMIYTLADLIVVGQFIGSAGLSAISISGQITMLLASIGIGLGAGGQIVIAQYVGKKDYASLKPTIGTLVTFKILMGLVIAVIGISCSSGLLQLMNTPAEAFDYAKDYLVICCFGIPFLFGYNAFCAALRGMGDSKRPLIFIAISAGLNIVLDIIFVGPLNMGAAGAAIATVISQIACCAAAFVILYRRREDFGFDFKLKSFALNRAKLFIIVRLSAPLVFMNICITLSMMYVNSYINDFGLTATSVNGAGNKLYSVVSVITNSLQTAVSTMVGQNIGAGKPERVKKTVYSAWVICIGFVLIIILDTQLFPQQIFRIFTSDADVIALAPAYFDVMWIMYLSFALMAPPLGFINGIGFTALNMGIAVLDGVLARVGLSLLLGITLGFGLTGFWYGTSLAGYVSVILASLYFFFGKWQTRKTL